MSEATAKKIRPSATQEEVLSGVVPYLTVGGAVKAAEYYAKAFGAKPAGIHPVDDKGRTMHVHLHINGGSVMLSDAYPEYGHPLREAQGYTMHMQVDDVQAWWDRAVAAGCEIVMPLQVMFWGDRYGQVRDPFGVLWSMGAPAE